MADYVAPEIKDLKALAGQQIIVDYVLEAVAEAAPVFWEKSSGAGKSTVRALIADAILNADDQPLYEVGPIDRSKR